MKRSLLILSVIFPYLIFSQYSYEPSPEHPFGLPNPKAPSELMDFAPLIGECNCKSQTRNQDQTWAEPIDMLWRFKYIMNGMAVQDETLKADEGYSGSIRQFIPDSTRWYVHYYSSRAPSTILPTWEGKKNEAGKIVLYREQKAPNGMEGYYRLSFYDIDDKGFKWIGEWVSLDETIVYPTWKIDCSNGKIPSQEEDKAAIIEASNRFSKAFMAKDVDGMVDVYATDAKIFPHNLEILSGTDLRNYWTPRNDSSSTIHHKITSEYIKFFGDHAHDYGYYEGKTKSEDGTISNWRGKYLIIWKKENGDWKMYLDMWNSIKD